MVALHDADAAIVKITTLLSTDSVRHHHTDELQLLEST